MANLSPILFPSQLYANALAQLGRRHSVGFIHAYALHQHERLLYILRVLAASPEIRAEVRDEAIANVAADPDNDEVEGQRQLVCILTMFELLSSPEKEEFIRYFKVNAVIAGHGPIEVVLDHTYQPGHVPPYFEP